MSYGYTDIQLSILLVLYRSDKPLTRYKIAKELKLPKQTIAHNISKFLEQGIVTETKKGICIVELFKNNTIYELFFDIINRLIPLMELEEIIGNSESDEIATVLKNCFIIILLLSMERMDRNNLPKIYKDENISQDCD